MPLASALIAFAALAFWAYCLYDFARTDEQQIRTFTRPVWVLLLVFTSVFGSLMWVYLGRPERRTPR